MSNIIEIPRYQSHKQVQALKIKLAIMNPRGVELHFENERFCPIQMPLEFARKHTDGQGVQALAGGYVVWYEDGYTSWSPAEAFEGGYTLIQQHDSDCSTNNRGVPELLGPCDCSVSVTVKPALTVERIREELADMVGLKLNPDTNAEIVRRLNAMGLFDFGVMAEPSCTDERPCVNCFSGQGKCLDKSQGKPDCLSKIASAELVKCQPGDLAIIRVEAESLTADDMVAVKRYLKAAIGNDAGVKVLVIAGDAEVTSMSEEQLKQVGLVRVVSKEADDLTQFLEQTDFDAAEKVASSTVDNQQALPAGEDDCEGCKI